MLTENDVVDAVCEFLISKGWRIDTKARSTQKGPDIVARTDKTVLIIEAKGETSDREGSARHGKPFDSSQCQDHVANALFSAAEALQTPPSPGKTLIGIALPKTKTHQKFVGQVRVALDLLGVIVFWVDQDNAVIVTPCTQLDWNAD